MTKQDEIFPPDIFRQPSMRTTYNEEGRTMQRPDFNWVEQPLAKKLLDIEAQRSDTLRRAMLNDLTRDFFSTLHHKATRKPPENINVEIKGETRSGKSTAGITIGLTISRYWGHEFTEENILPNQGELLYKLKDAKYGETFLVDEQTPETFGEGILRETEQLGMNLNICAKKCNNLIFIYPPTFTARNSPFGLETQAKDVQNKYIKCFYYDLKRMNFGGGQVPRGFVTIPKFVDVKYKKQKESEWSELRIKNFKEKKYDFDSLLEERYENKKDDWIEMVRNMDASVRDKKKEELAQELAKDDKFLQLKNMGQRLAYLKLMSIRGQSIEMAKGELETVANLAMIIAMENADDS